MIVLQGGTLAGAVLLGLRPAAAQSVLEDMLEPMLRCALASTDSQLCASSALGIASLLNKQPAGERMSSSIPDALRTMTSLLAGPGRSLPALCTHNLQIPR